MSYFDPTGQEWISKEAYEGFIHKKPKKIRIEYKSPFMCAIKGQCTRCDRRKATTRSYRGQKVCQNCNLEIIDHWNETHPIR